MFKNTFKLTGFILKREKTNSSVWIAAMVGINALLVLLMGFAVLTDAAERIEMLSMLENPSLQAMVGPLHSINTYDFGSVYTLLMMLMMSIPVAIMNIFHIIRHTRADEELGRYEVLRSLPSGRLSNINAAMLSAVILNVAMAILFALTMWLTVGIADGYWGFAPALLWGVSLGAVGITFAAVAALFSQLCASSRGAMGFSFFIMAIFYAIRAGADMDLARESEVWAIISPFGLISRSWIYVYNYWWPVLVVLGIGVVFAAFAYWVCSFRDIDQGVIPARRGRAKGGQLMRSTLGLNFRLLRLSIIVWVIMMFSFGASYSMVLEDIENFVANNDMYQQLMLAPVPGLLEQLEGAPTEEIAAIMNEVLAHQGLNIVQMFSNMIGIPMVMLSLVPVILFITKAKSEEKNMRTELLVATAASKKGYLAGLVLFSFVTAFLMQLAQAVGLWSVAQSVLPNPGDLPLSFLLQSALVYVPAMWVMGGIVTLLVGLAPKLTGIIWGYFAFSFVAMMFGRMISQLAFLVNFTPLGFVPQLPMDEINAVTLVAMALVGVGLAAVGIVFYEKRDINAVTG